MADLGQPYIALDDFKAYLKIKPEKIEQDGLLNEAIASASGEIETHCNRQFNRAEVATPRVYPAASLMEVEVDDFWTATDLVVAVDLDDDGVFETVVDPSDYELYPANGVVSGQVGWPFWRIDFVNVWLPQHTRRKNIVQVTAKWGWAAVPEAVRQATEIIAAETYQLKDAPFGTAGMDQFGNIYHVRDNRIAAGKLARYCRKRIPVG